MASIKSLTRRLCLCLAAFAFLQPAMVRAQNLQSLMLQIRPNGSYLGLKLLEIDDARAKTLKLSESEGVEIAFVEEGAPADQAGLKPGDVILSFNGEKVLGLQQFVRLVGETPPGRHVRLVCWRANAQKAITVITGSHTSPAAETLDITKLRVMDVPSPMMIWRNLILGVDSEALNDQLAQVFGVKQGILIWAVTMSYPAQRAGVRAGDVLTTLCGHAIHSPRELGIVIQQAPNSQKTVALELVRDHKVITMQVPLDGSSDGDR